MKKGTSKLGSYISISKGLTPIVSYTAFTMNRISELITRENILEVIEEKYSLVNKARLFFSLLFLLEVVYSKLGYLRLPIDNI